MKIFYADKNGNVIGPIDREALQHIAQSGALSADTQVCVEGTEEWRPLADILPKQTRVSTPLTSKSTTQPQAVASRLPLILATAALILSSITAAKVFWPKRGVAQYSFKTPQEAIQSTMALTMHGTLDDMRELQKRKSHSEGNWSYEFLDKEAVELHKTLEVTGSGNKEMNGQILCFLRLKCPDGVNRYSMAVFAKGKDGDFYQSEYPGYIPSDDLTSDDRRLAELIKKWETTGTLSE